MNLALSRNFVNILLDKKIFFTYNTYKIRREVEQLAARQAHNLEAVGSSPTLAIKGIHLVVNTFFLSCVRKKIRFQVSLEADAN